jgi:tripartite-type tricarboxylate transporter receptor subunit TctC
MDTAIFLNRRARMTKGRPPNGNHAVAVRRPVVAATLAFMAMVAATPAALAQNGFDERKVAEFYKGKTISIVVGFSPGGSFDITARNIARHIGQYIPGKPDVIVENSPGAGTMLAMNKIYNTLPKDGTVIGSVIGDIIKHPLFGNPAAKFDITKMRILSAPAPIVHMLIVTKESGVTKLSEIMGPNPAKKVKIGATGKGTSVSNSAFLAQTVVGLNYTISTGYGGFAKVKLALEQGEVNATFNNIHELMGLYKDKIDSGEWKIIAQSSLEPHPKAPNVPVLADLAKSPEDKDLLRLGAILPMRSAFMYTLAPGVPEDRANAIEQALDKTFADKEFVASMEKSGLVVDPIPAKEMRQFVADYMSMPQAVKDRLAPVLK